MCTWSSRAPNVAYNSFGLHQVVNVKFVTGQVFFTFFYFYCTNIKIQLLYNLQIPSQLSQFEHSVTLQQVLLATASYKLTRTKDANYSILSNTATKYYVLGTGAWSTLNTLFKF